ncbi:MAG: hypothetical protein AAFX44_13550 [Pseudomonadota bacterium]
MGNPSVVTAPRGLNRWPLPARVGIAFAFWLVVIAIVALFAGDLLSTALLPVIKLGAGGLLAQPLSIESLRFSSVQDVPVFELRAVVATPWEFLNHTIPVGSNLQVTVPRAHTLYHVVVIGALVLAWPSPNLRRRAWLLGLACAAVILSALIDAPINLAAQAHALFYERFAPAELDSSWLIRSARFLDHGGRLLLGVLLATAVIAIVAAPPRRKRRRKARRRRPAR